jgi:type IV pilus assembly protein PilQ
MMSWGKAPMTAITNTRQSAGRATVRMLVGSAVLALATSSVALAENELRDIRYSAAPSGAVEITLELANAAGDANVFTTEDPPTISVDLPATRNRFDKRRLTVGTGATSAINALEAGGRTRVVVDLFRAASFESRAEGNRLILKIGAGEAAMGATALASRDPAKRLAVGPQVANLDFRRAPSGAGRIVVSFDAENFGADFRDDGNGVVIEFAGVTLPAALAERLDVTDFATPVETVELAPAPSGARLAIRTVGPYESLAYQTGGEYIIELAPVAVVESGALGIIGADLVRGYTGTPVTFNFQNIPVRTVLQLIAEESGLNVVAADTVTGSVTLRLVNVPWDQALDIVLRAKGLDQRRDGNVIWIAPQQEIAGFEQAKADARLALEQRAPLITEYIPINYGNAEEIALLLTESAKQAGGGGAGAGGAGGSIQAKGFLSERGNVSFDRRTNTLLLNDTEEKIREIRALIALLDRPVDQVLIEARIVIASETFARELGARFGVSGGYEDRRGNIVTTTGSQAGADRMANLALANRFAGSGTGLPVARPGAVGSGVLVPALTERLNVNLPAGGSAGAIGFAILGADYLLDLELSALESEGRGEVVASPRVITANQREALIRQGDEIGYVTVTPATAGGVPTPSVQFKEALLELTVTPTITQDGRVYLVVNVKKDELAGFVDTSIGQVPQITTREVSTAVLVDNAQTVVIGGVYEFKSREDLSKVPYLGDVPFLGNLFRRKGRSTEKAELLIFVTPKVLVVTGRPQ